MAKPSPVRSPSRSRVARPATGALRIDAERYPNVQANPALERALRIRQALGQGLPREAAVALAEQVMGKRAPHRSTARPKAQARPPRAAGKRTARGKVR